jgi:hypothetical protein
MADKPWRTSGILAGNLFSIAVLANHDGGTGM